jgi:glycosyltransferase involved in cell wall biosynthesis
MNCIIQIGPFPQSISSIRGGVEASVFGLAKAQSTSYEVHVFDIPRIGGNRAIENIEGVTVHRFCNQGGRQYTAGRQVDLITKEIQALQPEICHIHGTGLFSWLMYRKLVKLRLPVVVTVHGLVWVEKRNALKKGFSAKKLFQYLYQGCVEKHFLSRLPMAIVDTEYVKDRINQYRIRKKPIMHVIPQGIDESFFSLKCSKDSQMVLSVGAIGERKGHLHTLKAFELLESKGIDAQLVIVGAIADNGYLERLKNAIAKSKYGGQISLLTNVSDETLKRLYEKAHLFVLHSEEESQGIVFAEAMATGLPIVSTQVGGVPFVVRHGENGLLSAFGEIELFAEHIQSMITDAILWQTMSDASLKLAEAYHWHVISEKIITLYHSNN